MSEADDWTPERSTMAEHGTHVMARTTITIAAAALVVAIWAAAPSPSPARAEGTTKPAVSATREYQDSVAERRAAYARIIAPGNLAAGRSLRYVPCPNYGLTTDAGDPQQLTDGELGRRGDERIWFDKEAVCWTGSPLVTIFADLEDDKPIESVVLRLLGGNEQGGLTFPDEIRILLSDDGRNYYLAAARHKRLADDANDDGWDLPEVKVAWVHNFVVPVCTKARYLAVQIRHQLQYIASDEIAIVRGGDDLPAFKPDARRRVEVVTAGVAFSPMYEVHPIATQPLRTKLAMIDARPAADFNKPCRLVVDLPPTAKLVSPRLTATPVVHDGETYQRYLVSCTRGRLDDFYLQSTLPPGATGTLYLYGDANDGPRNERRVTWQSIEIPTARRPQRLHVSLAWTHSETVHQQWPGYLQAMGDMGFNAVGCFPRYWNRKDVPKHQAFFEAARKAGFAVIVNESPGSAPDQDRSKPETKSQLAAGPSRHVCPSYRGQYYTKEHELYAQHVVWSRADYIFYDIEEFYDGAQEAPKCSRCKKRFEEGHFRDWDDFRAAMGREIHADMKKAIDKALAAAGIEHKTVYGSYRTDPVTPLNDGLFAWDRLYPDLLQIAMPSLYVAGDQMAVAGRVAAIRAKLPGNDIIPWLSTGTYGQYEPSHTRDMILEAFANGAKGITYYEYGDFDPLHFKYHAEAIDIVAPVEDIFMDGRPIAALACDQARVKICGMAADGQAVILVSNYAGVKPGTKVNVSLPGGLNIGGSVWDLHSRRKIGDFQPGKDLPLVLDDAHAHLYYIGDKYAAAITTRPQPASQPAATQPKP